MASKVATPVNGNRPRVAVHDALLELIYSNIQVWAPNVKREMPLPNGRIADLYFTFMEKQIIVEVKTTLKVSLLHDVFSKYWNQCDFLIVAAPATAFEALDRTQDLTWAEEKLDRLGHLWVTTSGMVMHQLPQQMPRKTGLKR